MRASNIIYLGISVSSEWVFYPLFEGPAYLGGESRAHLVRLAYRLRTLKTDGF